MLDSERVQHLLVGGEFLLKYLDTEAEALSLASMLNLYITKKEGKFIVSNDLAAIVKETEFECIYHDRNSLQLSNFESNLGKPNKYVFYDANIWRILNYFDGTLSLLDTSIVDGSTVEIPYGITDAYKMFNGCAFMETAPSIPESIVKARQMFADCTHLKVTPKLPNSLHDASGMFKGCSDLEKVNNIPSSIRVSKAMFKSCHRLPESELLRVSTILKVPIHDLIHQG